MAATPDSPCANLNMAAGVFRHAELRPEAIALVIDGRAYTYAELRDGASRVAAWLRAEAAPSPRVAVLASRSFETYAGILGAAAAGGTWVALNPKQPVARLRSIVARAGLEALVMDGQGSAKAADDLWSSFPACVLSDDDSGVPNALRWKDLPSPDALPPSDIAPDHAAYIMFTSGTTGSPKGVVVTAGNVAHFLAIVHDLYGIGPGDRAGQIAETSFDLSVFEMFSAWQGGASLHVVPDSQLMAPAAFIRREQLTIWTSVPSVIAIMSRMKLLEPGLFPTLRVSFFIGEALPTRSAIAWQQAAPSSVIDNHYGPTEATVACTVQRLGDPPLETQGRGTLAIGAPYAGMEADVVSDGVFLEQGETGELALFGPQLAQGYLDDPEQTGRRFPTLDHPRLGRGRWYLTGDLACRDANGVLHWLGRTDHQVKIMGHRVELEDLEAHLRVASGTDSAAAVAWPLVDGSAQGVAAFVAGARETTSRIRETLRELVPAYMVPRRIVALDALPLSPNGKIDRKALVAILEEEA